VAPLMLRKFALAVIAAVAGVLAFSGAAWALAAVTTADVNVREGPGTRYSIITAIPANTPVDVEGCQSGWCLANIDGLRGWISERYLSGLVSPPVIAPIIIPYPVHFDWVHWRYYPYYTRYHHRPPAVLPRPHRPPAVLPRPHRPPAVLPHPPGRRPRSRALTGRRATRQAMRGAIAFTVKASKRRPAPRRSGWPDIGPTNGAAGAGLLRRPGYS
jgi:hypothetical protein